MIHASIAAILQTECLYRHFDNRRQCGLCPLLVVLGVRTDGQKVLLAIRSMGGESAEAWRIFP